MAGRANARTPLRGGGQGTSWDIEVDGFIGWLMGLLMVNSDL